MDIKENNNLLKIGEILVKEGYAKKLIGIVFLIQKANILSYRLKQLKN